MPGSPSAISANEVEAVEAAVGEAVAEVEPMDGMTNRNFRVRTAAGDVLAVRLPGAGSGAYIDRTAERHNAERAAFLGVNCPIVSITDDGTMVCRFLDGTPLTGDRLRNERGMLAEIARLLRLVHREAGRFEGRFDPWDEIDRHRAALPSVPRGVDELIADVTRARPSDRVALVPCHNDPWPPNFIAADERVYLVDWEYSGMNDAAWDLADLSVEAELDDDAEAALLAAYGTDPDGEMAGRVRALKAVTDTLWGLWALVQVADGNPADDFEPYGLDRLARARRW